MCIRYTLNYLENFTYYRPIKKKSVNLNQILRSSKVSVDAMFNKKKINYLENYDPS